MPITKRPGAATPNAEIAKFIEAAPDGDKDSGVADEKDSVQITLRITKTHLERLTKTAARQGIPRASYIKRAVFMQLEADEKGAAG